MAVIVTAFAGCNEQEIEMYSGEEGVYFYIGERVSVGDIYLDSITTIQFGRLQVSEVERVFRVMTTGRIKDYDRKVKIEVNADSSTAVAVLNYAPLEDFYIVEAGKQYVDIPIRFFDNENIAEEEKRLDIRLLPTEDFTIGIPTWYPVSGSTTSADSKPVDCTRHRILVSGFVPQPRGWSGSYNATTLVETGIMGAFSMEKLQVICDVCHMDYEYFDTRINSTPQRTAIAESVALYLIRKYRERDPVLERDGRLMWVQRVGWTSTIGVPWDGYFNPSI
jgi:hypothetical protein